MIALSDFENDDPIKSENGDRPVLCIGMSFYNEDPQEIRRTLVSLSDQVKEIDPTAICHVVMVSDGHAQMHPETKKLVIFKSLYPIKCFSNRYLRALFCNKQSEFKEFDQIYSR